MSRKTIIGIVTASGLFLITIYFLLTTIAPPKDPNPVYRFYLDYDVRPDMEKYKELTRTPFSVHRIVGKSVDKTYFDHIYVADEFNMRVPIKKVPDATHHSIFAGCSFAYGTGIEVNETLAANYQEKKPGHQSYNLGFPGGGAQHILRYFDYFDLKDAVKQDKGEFYYIFITEQLDRFFLRYNSLAWMNHFSPHYEMVEGKITYKGQILDQEKAKFFYMMRKLKLSNFLINVEGFNKYTEEELEIFALAIKEIKNRYLEKFPKGEFKFVVHPLGITDPAIANKLISILSRHKIDSFNTKKFYSGKWDRKKFELERDRHPNGVFNRQFAENLAK